MAKTEVKHFSIDARTILQLGRESIKDHTTAVLELVKNSYDADATEVVVEIHQQGPRAHIRVIDNGVGMRAQDIDERWLRIGYSAKLADRVSKRRRRKTGEKGVGRISADRLGAELELRTKAKGESAVGLLVDWNRFDVDGKELGDVPVSVIAEPKVDVPPVTSRRTGSGTELIIRRLRQEWTEQDVRVLHEELAVLTPPFRAVEDFSIYLHTDIAPDLDGRVESPFYSVAEIELEAELHNSSVTYKLADRITTSTLTDRQHSTISWQQLVHRAAKGSTERESKPVIGPVGLHLLFYPRKSALMEGTNFRVTELREFLNRNAGVKIYRDMIRVRPYGDPDSAEGDWLGLAERKTREPAGVSRATYRVSAGQLVGAVFLSRDDNPALVDSASREGLVHGDAFADLRSFVLGCLQLLEAHRYEEYRTKRQRSKRPSPLVEVRSLQRELAALKGDLAAVRKSVPASAARPVARALDQVNVVAQRLTTAQASIQDVLSETGVLRGLGTLGIAASVFGHETQSAISNFVAAATLAGRYLKDDPPEVALASDEIGKANRYAKQVSAWGAFALARVRRDKRERREVHVDKTVQSIRNDLLPAFRAASTELRLTTEAVTANTFEMDVEAVCLNLLTNAYIACQQTSRRRVVNVELGLQRAEGRSGFTLRVSDTGPGVPEKLREKIWQPLYTTRRDETGKDIGTGLGLTIVQTIVDDLGGTRQVAADDQLGGALVSIWLPLE